jgi:hypothetical protein
MLELTIPAQDQVWDSEKQEFSSHRGATIRLEHSLISISKWESKYHKPFLEEVEMTMDELNYYIKCMTLTQSVPDEIYNYLTEENYMAIKDYIADPMTATSFYDNTPGKKGPGPRKQIVTSELIYYWMIAQNIPLECEKWHLNRLMTLIKICSIKNAEANGKSPKMSRREILQSNAELNRKRREAMHTKG